MKKRGRPRKNPEVIDEINNEEEINIEEIENAEEQIETGDAKEQPEETNSDTSKDDEEYKLQENEKIVEINEKRYIEVTEITQGIKYLKNLIGEQI